jgi:hypothetical protein
MNQDSSQNRPKTPKVTKNAVFGNVCFVLFFAVNVQHQVSQESPERAQKLPKTTAESLQEAIKNRIHFLIHFLPEIDSQNDPQKWFQN